MEQEGGRDSLNIQIGTVNNGITYNDVKEITLDLFKSNFYELSSHAAEVALTRVEEFIAEFIKMANLNAGINMSKFEEPSVQYSIFNAQKEYAKTGDPNLKNAYINLLLKRVSCDDRCFDQILIDEVIITLPKLTAEQVDCLTLVFIVLRLKREVTGLHLLKNHIANIFTFYNDMFGKESFYLYIKYTGTCTILSEGAKYKPISEIFLNRYKGLFNKGFTIAELVDSVNNDSTLYEKLYVNCLQDPTKKQLNALNDRTLENEIVKYNIVIDVEKLKSFYNTKYMTIEEVETYLISLEPRMMQLMQYWKETQMKDILLTPVGTIIAVLNYNTKTNSNIDFKEYINN